MGNAPFLSGFASHTLQVIVRDAGANGPPLCNRQGKHGPARSSFHVRIPAVASRQPKSDRLSFSRAFLGLEAADDKRLNEREAEIKAAHAVLLKWADLESSGRSRGTGTKRKCRATSAGQVFGERLAYAGPLEGGEVWHREQHYRIGDETPDAALGFFRQGGPDRPLVVIEFKGPRVHLDRDRSNGRTAVDQCWNYMVNTPPDCRWGVVSNIVSFRLYERASTKRVYEHFSLQSLRDYELFKQFYVLFHRQGLVDDWMHGVFAQAVAAL